MKQKFLLKTMLLLCALVVGGVSNAWGAENDTHDFSQTLQQLLNNSASITSINIAQQSYPVKKVVVSYRYNKTIKDAVTVAVSVGGNSWGSQNVVGTGSNYTTMEFTGDATTGNIVLSFTNNTGNGTGHGTFYVNNVQLVEGAAAGTPSISAKDVNIAYNATGGSIGYSLENGDGNVSASVTSGNWLTLGEITGDEVPFTCSANPGTTDRTATVTLSYMGATDKVVTVTQAAAPVTYTVTLSDDPANPMTEYAPGVGTTLPERDALNGYEFVGWSETNVSSETTEAPTIIPAGTYYPTANITLYPVYTKTVAGGGTTHESASVTVSEYATANSWGSSSSSNQKNINLDSNVTATCSSGTNSGKYYNDGWRIYQTESAKITISTTSGELTSVTFTFTNSNGGTLNFNSSALTSGTAVDVSGTSAEFVLGNSGSATNGQIRITAISVNYDIAGAGTTYYWSAPVAAAVEMPSIVIAENPFMFSTTATITCATEGAAIKYSYDGENWSDYSSALTITATTTIYAKAVKNEAESSVAQVTASKILATPTVTVSGNLTVDLDGETDVEAGTLTAAVTYNEEAVAGAVVTWTSSNTDVATINAETGAVTIKTTGTVTFTATYAGNSDYAETTGTKTVTIINSKAPGSEARPYTVAQAIEATPASGTSEKVYIHGFVSAFYNTSIVGDGSNYRYYISDDGTTTNQLLVYRGKGLDEVTFANASDLEIGDEVVIYGGLTTYDSTKEVASGNYLISRIEKPASDLAKTSDITLDFKNGNTEADLTEYFTTSSTGAITYTVADETVIENADELISALKVGTTTVTVSQAATLSYKAGEITINVTVQDTREAATTIPAINIETLKVNDAGTISVVNPVKADEGVTFSFASSDDDVLLVADGEYAALAVGTATVTVTATPSNTNLYKPVVANFEVTVETDVKTDTEIALDEENGSTVYGTPKSVDFVITDGYDGEMGYTISNIAIADVEIGADAITFTPKAVGTAVITISALATATYNAAEDVEYTLTVTAPEGDETAPATASPVTLDFSDNTDWSFPTSKTVTANTYTSGDYSVVLTGTTGNGYYFFGQNDCLLIGKSGATIQLPSFNNVVEQIDVTGHSGASSSVKLNIFEGETAVSTEVTGITSTQNFEIAEANQGANKTYTLKVTSAANAQIKTIKFNFKNVTIQTTLNAFGYATFCSQYPLDFTTTDGYTAWQVKEISGETITFEKITSKIKGGQGILLMGEAGATVTLASADSDNEMTANLLFGTTAPTYIAADTYYGLSGNTFKKVNAGTVPAGKALLPASAVGGEVKAFTFVFEDDPDGIKTIDNGQLTIDNAIYDLSGRKINVLPVGQAQQSSMFNGKLPKGLYIVNGKKVMVK